MDFKQTIRFQDPLANLSGQGHKKNSLKVLAYMYRPVYILAFIYQISHDSICVSPS